MNSIQHIQSVYLLGAGGIGMSALARYFAARGKKVAGYDKTPTPLTAELISEGIEIHFDDEVEAIPDVIKSTAPENLLIIYTPAIPAAHKGFNWLQSNGFTLYKRSEVLGFISQDSRCIGIAGTHGKTTTTAITAHLLEFCGLNPTAFVGGIMSGYNSNFIDHPESDLTVVEADEFDRSFLRLSPTVAVITNMDPDHLDIYGTHDALITSFREYAEKIKPEGCLIIQESVAHLIPETRRRIVYGLSDSADVQISDIRIQDGMACFTLSGRLGFKGQFALSMPGTHNLLNATAALIAAREAGAPDEMLTRALPAFAGVKRRFERVAAKNGLVYIDDYAHHPTEISACIEAARMLFPGKKIKGIFQPHLFTRTRDFADGFAQSLSALDELILLNIYPARELPLPGVTSEMLLSAINCPARLLDDTALMDTLKHELHSTEVLLTIGAGDIDRFVPQIKNLILNS